MVFSYDLCHGSNVEQEVADIYESHGYKCTITQGQCDYDIDRDDGVKIEVKSDRKGHLTGNIAIERAYKGSPSGIYNTQATLVVYKILGEFWEFDIDTIKSIEPHTVTMGGDGLNSELGLYRIDEIIKHGKRINRD